MSRQYKTTPAQRATMKRYIERNKEKILARQRERYRERSPEIIAKVAKYQKAHKEERRIYMRNWRMLKQMTKVKLTWWGEIRR